MKLVSLLFSFEGRVGRGQFWLAAAIYVAVALVIVAASLAADSSAVSIVLQLALGIPCLVSLVAVGIKRLHDRDKSAWWLLVFYLVPLTTFSWANGMQDGAPQTTLSTFGLSVLLWALVELGCLRGTIGGNPYGPDPVAPKPAVH